MRLANALLTGSQAYGTPGPDSDIDLVALVSDQDLQRLVTLCSEGVANDDPRSRPAEGEASLKIGRLNLILTSDPESFDVWAKGTATLKKRAPVKREDAVALFDTLRNELAASRATEF